MTKVTRKQAENALNKGAKRVTEDDVTKVLEKQKEIQEKFSKAGPLGKFVEDLKLFFQLLKDYSSRRYREIPFWTIAAIVAALLYVINHIDLIPDFIPVVGYVDDALVVSICLSMIKNDLVKYQEWKFSQAEPQE